MGSGKERFYTNAFASMSNEALIKRYQFAQAAIVEITDNLRDGTNLHEENERELRESSNKLHIEMGVCGVLLAERGVDIEQTK